MSADAALEAAQWYADHADLNEASNVELATMYATLATAQYLAELVTIENAKGL